MSKPRVVHFVGDLPGLGEELIHKLVCSNVVCSIAKEWYNPIITNIATELEIFNATPLLFDSNNINSNDVLLYFGLNDAKLDLVQISNFSCDVILLVSEEINADFEQMNLKIIHLHDMIAYSTIADLDNNLDELLLHCQSNSKVDFPISSKKHWWVSQQDVATGLVRLIDNVALLPAKLDLCGRRGWTESETFQQLELLYNRTMAASSGQFQTNHLEPKPVIEATLAKASEITPSTRPDLSVINEILQQINGEGWRPLIPLRTSLMHYLATKDLA